MGRVTAYVLCATVALVGLITAPASCNLLSNPGFETGDFTGWQTLGDTSVVTSATAASGNVYGPNSGSYMARLQSNGVASSDAEAFLGLPQGYLNTLVGATTYNASVIKQAFHVEVGQHLQFSWNFLAMDYMPFNDFAFFTIVGPGGIDGMLASVSQTGDFGETGWMSDDYEYYGPNPGDYVLGLGVVDTEDTQLPSVLLVDDCPGNQVIPEPAALALAPIGLGLVGMLRRRFLG